MKLTIKNYQSHENSELEFVSPGINAICGKNGHGKSSVLRAMQAVPLGDSLDRRHGTKETKVDIDGVAKVFTNAKNQYEIDGAVYKALRSQVPQQVFDRLKLGPINFRSQHQPYFLLADSPGAVARAVNELTDLGVIDYVASSLRAEGRSLDDIKKKHELDLTKEKQKVKQLEWAIEADEDLTVIEAGTILVEEISKEIESLSVSIREVKSLGEKFVRYPHQEFITQVETAYERLETDNSTELSNLIDEIKNKNIWLESLPESMEVPVSQVQKRLAELPEVSSLAETLDKVREYTTDIALCPDPKPDIVRLAAISLPEVRLLQGTVEVATKLSGEVERLAQIEGWEVDLTMVELAFREARLRRESVEALSDTIHSYRNVAQVNELTQDVYERELDKFNALLKEVGTCPLCGGNTNETCLHS